MYENLHGVITALVTPFSDNGIAFDVLEELIEYQLNAEVDGILSLGTTGEVATITESEKKELLRVSSRMIKGKAKWFVGIGSNSTSVAVENAHVAESFGADALLAVTPFYNKCTRSGLIAHYEKICSSVHLPVFAYNVPSRTGVNLLPETAKELCKIENFAGIKEASGNMSQILETIALTKGKCNVYSGDDLLNLPILACGGVGTFSVLSNLFPKKVKKLYELIKSNRLDKAQELSSRLLPITKALFSSVNPIPIKYALKIIGFDVGMPRLPLTPLSKKEGKLIEKLLREVSV